MKPSPQNLLIELMYDDDMVLHAERLHNSGAVTDVQFLEESLYAAKINDGINYEVEIQHPFTKKQKNTCECAFYQEHGLCKHIITVLFELREIYRAQSDKKEKQKSIEPQKPTTLTIANILQEADHDELLSFLKNYAKTDRKFAMQLKVHFARQIDLADNASKYKDILNTLVKVHKGKSTQASASEIRSICAVLADFGAQIDDSLAIGQYREAFDIMESAFSKLEYIRHYYQYNIDTTDKLSFEYHARFESFLKEKIPMELRQKLWQFGLDLAGRSYYHFNHPLHNLIFVLSAEKDKELQKNISSLVVGTMDNKKEKESAVLYALHLYLKRNVTHDDIGMIKTKNLKIKDICDHLVIMKQDNLAIKLLEKYKVMHHPDKELINRLLALYSKTQNQNAFLDLTIGAFIQSADFKYLEIIDKNMNQHDKVVLWHEIEIKLREKNASDTLLARFFKKAGLTDRLGQLIVSNNDFTLLREHSDYFYKTNRVALLEIYEVLVFNYLSEHIGEQASKFVSDLLYFLQSEQMFFISDGLRKFIQKHFAHRLQLLDTIQ